MSLSRSVTGIVPQAWSSSGKPPVSETLSCSSCRTCQESRHQQIAVIGGRCQSRADNLQPSTVEAGHVMRYTPERLA